VYTNTQKAHLIGVIGSKIARIPCLSHFRDILPDTMLTKIWLYIFCLFTTKIIAISKAVRDRLPIKRKIKIIYNGVKMYPSSLQKSNSKCIIGYVGQIARWKGVEYFIKAAGLIQKELPKANFIVVGGAIFGDTQYLKELKQLALNLSLNGKLQFVGKKEDPIPYINKLDILVHPPVEPEPFGRILIEASLLGKPIVASHIGAIPEIIKDEETGILVPPRDSSAIASAIKRLINNPEFAKSMGERAKERAIKYFNVNKMVKEIEKTIIKTMEKNL
jgi:glycosyltransferase involved in cell wall biosynthesis